MTDAWNQGTGKRVTKQETTFVYIAHLSGPIHIYTFPSAYNLTYPSHKYKFTMKTLAYRPLSTALSSIKHR